MVSALSIAVAKLGHEVKIVIPRYYSVERSSLKPIPGPMGVPMGNGEEWSAVYTDFLPGTKEKIQTFFIDHEIFFGRDGIYGTPAEPDFLDNPRRFMFFCKAVFQLCRKIGWYPDILHAHDWPSAMVPVYLKFAERPYKKEFAQTSSILTIHNLGYQGIYSKDNFDYSSLGWDVFYKAGFEDWNMINLLKAGLYSADKLNTVSPNYAEETKTQFFGFRLDGVLRYRSADYSGILNGIDTGVWNPEKDKLIPMPYSVKNMEGKAKAKLELQKEFGLPVDPKIPVFGMITRLTDQKGVGELFGPTYGSIWSLCREMNIQMALIGTGESWCENEIKSLSSRLSNFKAKIMYSEKVSHLIEAGSDFFLMPSRYEPCGLNQMYSLNYGTLPIVRKTGGFIDTVENYDQKTGAGTGFMFNDLTPSAIFDTVGWAVWTWYNKPDHISDMRLRGMKKDFSWKTSAKKYLDLYDNAITMNSSSVNDQKPPVSQRN